METWMKSSLQTAKTTSQASTLDWERAGHPHRNCLKSDCKTAPLVFLNYNHANTVLVCFNILYILSTARAEKRSRNLEQLNVHVSTNSSHEALFCFRCLQMVLLAVELWNCTCDFVRGL